MRARAPAGWAVLGRPGYDFVWFVGPGLVSALIALGIGLFDPRPSSSDTGIGLWILGIVLVDVAHVWASLYRTYLDPAARTLHRRRLWLTPLLCAWFGVLLHLESPRWFWLVLAYIAIFHFIKQHIGFALLYVRARDESIRDRRLVEATLWAGTIGPVLWWHAHLPTQFVWFVPGDLITGAPPWLGSLALLAPIPLWVAFTHRRIQLRQQSHPLVPWLVIVPALNWHLGIVVFNDDRIFTITNVFAHGIPYLALVWVTGGKQTVQRGLGPPARRLGIALGAYYGLVVLLAVTEEALWDRLIWHDHPELFGAGASLLNAHPIQQAIIVALLTVPQATHYILDRFIWRIGPQNPALSHQLGLRSPGAAP